ncbi:MAG: nucleotidyltransferase family protein [Methylobacillus sp.]|jgi:molybdenum cofactor cytidylyltransferase|nr:nucleotidyltransferase family protein [Methylobacillus sp.]
MHTIAPIVLAAGSSSRFGSDKLLHLVDGMPLAARSLLPWLQVFEQVTVITRADSGQLQNAVTQALGMERAARIHWQPCADADSGMSASLIAGVSRHRDASGWLIGLADMPMVPGEIIIAVATAIDAGAPLTAPFFHEKRGHPVGFSACYLDDLLALDGDAGARKILERDVEKLQRIATDNPGILFDIDRPEDFQQLS